MNIMKTKMFGVKLKMAIYLTFLLPAMTFLISNIIVVYTWAYLMYILGFTPDEYVAVEKAADTCQDITLTCHENAELISAVIWFVISTQLIF